MERARSPEDLRAWVLRKSRELAASPESKTFARSGATLPKKFHDEIYPLSVFALREYGGQANVLVQPNLGNDNFDAKVTVTKASGTQTAFIEITYAKNGYDESLRMEVLAKEGGVVLTGPITKSGRRGSPNRTVTVTPEAASHTKTLEDYLKLVEARVQAKARGRYGRNHILLVAVDDYRPLVQDSDWPLVDERARSLISTLSLDFGRVVYVGVAGRLLLSYTCHRERRQMCSNRAPDRDGREAAHFGQTSSAPARGRER